jgi:hypothetical protein
MMSWSRAEFSPRSMEPPGEAAGTAEAEHDIARLVHVVEQDAGGRMLVGKQRLAHMRIGFDREGRETERERAHDGARALKRRHVTAPVDAGHARRRL